MSFYKAYILIFLKIGLYKMTSISTPRHPISISKGKLESRHPHNFSRFLKFVMKSVDLSQITIQTHS